MGSTDSGKSIAGAFFILYVLDQEKSAAFYKRVLEVKPTLHVPGMTEFTLGHGAKLGLMPQKGIRALLGEDLPDPEKGRGIPRAEVYVQVDDPGAFHARAIECGAVEMAPPSLRPWGDVAGYCLDPDGHVLAFACPAGA